MCYCVDNYFLFPDFGCGRQRQEKSNSFWGDVKMDKVF